MLSRFKHFGFMPPAYVKPYVKRQKNDAADVVPPYHPRQRNELGRPISRYRDRQS
jgi:hypothetical protein